MTTCPGSPELLEGGIVPMDSEAALRVIMPQDYADTFTCNWQAHEEVG